MTKPYLSPDDLPSFKTTQISEILLTQLEEATKKSFYLACDKIVKVVLCSCHWYFKIQSGILILVMVCHDINSYQNVMITVPSLAEKLKRFANKAQISISSPINNGIPWVMTIDEPYPDEES